MDSARKILALLLLASALSTFNFVTAGDSSKPGEQQPQEKDSSTSEDSSQDDSKEKRSREEILFGNQQNKPSGLVDDLMALSDTDDSDVESSKDYDKKASTAEDNAVDMSSKDESDNEMPREPGDSNDMMMGSGSDSWYNAVPVSSSALQYLSNAQTLRALPSTDFSNSLYDQADLYRRKRQSLAHPLPLRKRRSLRSSLGQMIQKRGIRMPRRSMRLKRQVDMGDLLNMLGNDRMYEEQQQVPSYQSIDGWKNKMDKKHVPGHFSSYPETPAPEYRYPFSFQHRGDGILSLGNQFDDNKRENAENAETDDIDKLMLLHPNSRYIDLAEIGMFPLMSQEEEEEAFQKWLARQTTPTYSTNLPVSRRSVSTFYPLDYRYVPGYKKRSLIFNNRNRMPNGDSEDEESEFGKWGHVVQVPEVYASAEDVARLYGLANLMADGDEGAKMRRSV